MGIEIKTNIMGSIPGYSYEEIQKIRGIYQNPDFDVGYFISDGQGHVIKICDNKFDLSGIKSPGTYNGSSFYPVEGEITFTSNRS